MSATPHRGNIKKYAQMTAFAMKKIFAMKIFFDQKKNF